jgi:hypothetical protein
MNNIVELRNIYYLWIGFFEKKSKIGKSAGYQSLSSRKMLSASASKLLSISGLVLSLASAIKFISSASKLLSRFVVSLPLLLILMVPFTCIQLELVIQVLVVSLTLDISLSISADDWENFCPNMGAVTNAELSIVCAHVAKWCKTMEAATDTFSEAVARENCRIKTSPSQICRASSFSPTPSLPKMKAHLR